MVTTRGEPTFAGRVVHPHRQAPCAESWIFAKVRDFLDSAQFLFSAVAAAAALRFSASFGVLT